MKKSNWFGQVPIPHDLEDFKSEIYMWRAVLDQAIDDAIRRGKRDEIGIEAHEWLDSLSEDYVFVVDCAALDVEETRYRIKCLMEGDDNE